MEQISVNLIAIKETQWNEMKISLKILSHGI